jgi:hypothetical protein
MKCTRMLSVWAQAVQTKASQIVSAVPIVCAPRDAILNMAIPPVGNQLAHHDAK